MNFEKYIFPPNYEYDFEDPEYNKSEVVGLKESPDLDIEKEFKEKLFGLLSSYSGQDFPIYYRTYIADKIKKKIQKEFGYDVGRLIDVFGENIDNCEYQVFKYRVETENYADDDIDYEVFIDINHNIKYIRIIRYTATINMDSHDIPLY